MGVCPCRCSTVNNVLVLATAEQLIADGLVVDHYPHALSSVLTGEAYIVQEQQVDNRQQCVARIFSAADRKTELEERMQHLDSIRPKHSKMSAEPSAMEGTFSTTRQLYLT